MEGLRGIAVLLVFLQHYCTQFVYYTDINGNLRLFAAACSKYGNSGVDLFFVLSGMLIYGIVLRRRVQFLTFMRRRAIRLYPTFIVVLAISIAADLLRSPPYIPAGAISATLYLLANLAFLPGLFPITPIFSVNWSLSYEWWFYTTVTVAFSVCRGAVLPPVWRVGIILTLAAVLLALSAAGYAGTPVRAVSLLGGMLLTEAHLANLRPVRPSLALLAVGLAMVASIVVPLTPWASALLLTLGYTARTSAALCGDGRLSACLTWRYLRWFGNMSYSFYLMHGFVVIAILRALFHFLGKAQANTAFLAAIVPTFAAAICAGALLFLLVEKPLSLRPTTVKI